MKRAVIFDLDGTLLNTLPDIAAAMNRALAQAGLPAHPEEAYKLFTGDGAKNLTLRALGKRTDLFDQVYAFYSQDYARNSRVHTAPYPGIPDMLKTLSNAGMKLCVLSNKGDSDVRQVIAHYFRDIPFAHVQGVREGGPVKPDPRGPLEVAEAVGLPGEAFWYVGDTVTDMRCARNAGMESVAVTWGFQTREMLSEAAPDHWADSSQALTFLLAGA